MFYYVEAQVAGGIPFLQRTLATFNIPTSRSTILMDMNGYDAWVALSAIQDIFCFINTI